MTQPLSLHPTADLLEMYAMDRLTECQTAYVEEHMLLCRPCCDSLTAIDHELKMMRIVLGESDSAEKGCPQS